MSYIICVPVCSNKIPASVLPASFFIYFTICLSFGLHHCISLPFHQVAQYIKFEMPVLQSFITKLKEEEDREVQKLRRRYKKHCV